MPRVDLEVQKAFLDGINEVFSIMFTPDIEWLLLDTEKTKTNIYGETEEKIYKEPFYVVGNIKNNLEQEEEPQGVVKFNALIIIPTKQLLINDIPHDTEEDLEILRKSKFRYKGVEYLVIELDNTTLVADKYQFYKFQCYVDKARSI